MASDAHRQQPAGRIAAILIAVALAVAAPSCAARATPLLTASPNPVDPGTPVAFSLIDTIPRNDYVAGVDLTLTFDPAVLAFDTMYVNAGGWNGVQITPVSPGVIMIGGPTCAPACNPGILSVTDSTALVLDFNVLASAPGGPTSITAETSAAFIGQFGAYQLAPAVTGTVDVTGAQAVPAPGLNSFLLPGLVFAGFLARPRRRPL